MYKLKIRALLPVQGYQFGEGNYIKGTVIISQDKVFINNIRIHTHVGRLIWKDTIHGNDLKV